MGTPQTDVDMWSSSQRDPGAGLQDDQAQVRPDRGDGVHPRLDRTPRDRRETGAELQSDVERAREERNAAFGERDEALRGRAGDAYERTSARVAELLMGVDREVERIQTEARAEVERMLADAETEASRIRAEAAEQRRADQAKRRAREEAERSVADLTSQRERILEDLRLAGADARRHRRPGDTRTGPRHGADGGRRR